MYRSLARTASVVLFETALILGLVALAAWLRLGSAAWDDYVFGGAIWKGLLVTGVTQGCLYFADLYDPRKIADHREMVIRILQALGAASFILAGIYVWAPDMALGRLVFFYAAVFVFIAVIGWRLLFRYTMKAVGAQERLLLVGTNPAAVALAKELHENRIDAGIEIVGFVDLDSSRVGEPLFNPGIIGTIADIPSIVDTRRVDRVVVSLVDARGRLPMDDLLQMRLHRGVAFDHLASVYEEYTGKIAVENLRPSWLIFSQGFSKTRVLLAAKRGLDIAVASIGLVLAAPLMAIVWAMVRLGSKGPAIYRQERVGLGGRIFTVHKFRSMRLDAEAGTGAVWAQAKDPRITRVGNFIRRTRLDELPQLWNVLIGDMSMVGPRPERPEFVCKLTEQIPFYGLRHSVRPGVTGWAQIRYTYGASVEDAMQKLQYDLFYIKHMTVTFDLYVLFSTIKTVVLRRGSQ
jgi:sugar transferase (PEP-CTERM system associated)